MSAPINFSKPIPPQVTDTPQQPEMAHKLSKKTTGPTEDSDTQPHPEMHRKLSKVGEVHDVASAHEALDTSQRIKTRKPPAKLHRHAAAHFEDQPARMPSELDRPDSQKRVQTTPARPAKLTRSSGMVFDRDAIAESLGDLAIEDESPPENNHRFSLRTPFYQPGMDQAELRGRTSVKANKPRYYSNQPMEEAKDEKNVEKAPFPQTPAEPVKKMRYYSYALSQEDKQALAVGEKNHNLKAWTAKDLVEFQESRLQLVPRGIENRNAVIEAIQKEKKKCEQFRSRMQKQTSQSTPNLRASSGPEYPPVLTPLLTPEQAVPPAPQVIHAAFPQELQERASHARAASNGDYFSRPLARRPGRPLSQPLKRSEHTIRVRSPLTVEFKPKPDITFDTFLERHASGKGEVYRSAENAKKDDQPGDKEGSIELKPLDKASKKQINRLSKMPSMPSLRRRKSRIDTSAPIDKD